MSLTFKLIILGDQYSGKTSLMNRISSNTFYNTYSATIGVDYTNIKFSKDNKEYNIVLWDTSGQEKFSFLLNAYYSSVTGAIIVYDITNIASYNSVKRHINEFRSFKNDNNFPILVISNKIDLEKQRVVHKEELYRLKHMYNVFVLETSVKDNINLESIFDIFVNDIERKLLVGTLKPSNETGIKIKSKREVYNFEIENDEDNDKKCCNIL